MVTGRIMRWMEKDFINMRTEKVIKECGLEIRKKEKVNLLDNIGAYTYANGDKYDGEWIDDCKNGQGELYYANGRISFMDFEQNFFTNSTNSVND